MTNAPNWPRLSPVGGRLLSSLSNIWSVLEGRDPNRINLRKAARACILAPATFFFLDYALAQPLVAAFGFLSCFCHLVFANFGGPTTPRAIAYAASIALTSLVVVTGSLLSDTTGWAALGMFVLMFAAVFSTALGGYAPAFVSPLALAYACSIFIPLEAIGLGERVSAWAFGGVVALFGGVFLWPRDARAKLQDTLGDIISALGRAVASWANGQDGAKDLAEVESKLHALRANMEMSPLRPTAMGARDVGLLHMMESLIAATAAAKEVLAHDVRDMDRELAGQVIEGLARADAVLRGTADVGVMCDEIALLDTALKQGREHVQARLEALDEDQIDAAIESLHVSFPVLALAHMTLWIESDAAQARGLNLDAVDAEAQSSSAPLGLARARAIVRTHFDTGGVVFRNAARAATGLALGVLVAKTVPTGHGFWVVLGVATVLRTSAASTTATAVQAISGTLLGFAAAAAVVLSLDDNPDRLTWLVPPLVFLAAYSGGALGLAIGQMAFTTMVVVVFSVVKPAGLDVDIARVETILLGAVCASVVGFLMWPRGARAELARSVAEVFEAAAAALEAALSDDGQRRREAGGQLQAARQRARAAFVTALNERGEKLNAPDWALLSRPPAMLLALLQGLLPSFPAMSFKAGRIAAEAVRDQGRTVMDRLTFVSGALRGAQAKDAMPVRRDAAPELKACLKACFKTKRSALPDTLALIAWSDWLSQLDDSIDEAADAIGSVSGAAAPRAWLRWD